MTTVRHFDLCIIGSGSGNTIIDDRFADWNVAMVDKGIPGDGPGSGAFGGTCLNVGCIPTKMFVLPADHARAPREAERLGVDLRFEGAHWPSIRDRIFGRIDPIAAGGERYRAEADNVTLFRKPAHFVDAHTLDVGDEQITAEQFVLAAGSRAVLPPIRGLDQVTVHTSDTVMRLPQLPKSMIIFGGGYIAAEFAHVFSAFGTRVTVVVRSDGMLRDEDGDVSRRFTQLMADQVDLRLHQQADRIEELPDGTIVIHTTEGAMISGDVLLVATGRRPNSDLLDLDATPVQTDDKGYVLVDDQQRAVGADGSALPGFWALGDIDCTDQLKHVANEEARVVQHNLLHPEELIDSNRRFVPHAVFTDPQVASVGLTEKKAQAKGLDYTAATQDYGSVAYGWALEDTNHFIKLIADRRTGLLVGAHLIGPQASTLIQPLIQAMAFDLPAKQMARGQYWIHPALPEVIENALLALDLP